MKQFRTFITEEIATDTKVMTNLLVDEIYSKYVDRFSKNSPECVGWMDGTENSQERFQKIYEAVIVDDDSILDVGCGVGHLHTYLTNKGWNGKYLGFDPNEKAIDLVDEEINAIHGTIEDLDETKYDWVIANGVFNLGLKEEHAFWIIENMLKRANKGIIFNMLLAPYQDDRYESYNPNSISHKLQEHDHKEIKIVKSFLDNNAEFTVYFYKV